jgi:ATP-dependent DNA helicase DinG
VADTLPARVRDLFAPGGPLSRALPGFEPREGQRRLACAWAETLDDGGILVAEAATGIGKTLAYLLPSLLRGGKTLVSTATRTLQQQLSDNDFPVAASVVGRPLRCATVKGRGNYLCRRRWRRFALEPLFEFAAEGRLYSRMRDFAETTRTGDIAECAGVPEELRAWSEVNARAETCDPASCPDSGRCHLVEVRRKAAEADLVVVNHHLLFAHLALKDRAGNAADLLPAADALVLDEAHALEEAASSFFGVALSLGRALELVRDVRRLAAPPSSPFRNCLPAAEHFERESRRYFQGFPDREGRFPLEGRDAERASAGSLPLAEAVEELRTALADGPGSAEGSEAGREAEGLERRARTFLEELSSVLSPSPDPYVRWYERKGHAVTLCRTPVEVGPILGGALWADAPPTLLASATLSVGGSLDYFRRRVGLSGDSGGAPSIAPSEIVVDNEFDYEGRCIVCVPEGLPDPGDPTFPDEAARCASDALVASGGGALVLCTSYRILAAMGERLRGRFPWPVLVQGDAPRGELLNRFREEHDAVLIGTGTFWEGIDVPGESLRCVVIDKLPFAPPADPVVAARSKALRERGGDPFLEYQVPSAVLSFRQGVGRLLRRGDDYGAVVLLDRRIRTRPYGAVFRASIPRVRWTGDPDELPRFFRRFRGGGP